MSVSDRQIPDRQMLDRLPHREPFLFISEVLALEIGVSGQGKWTVKGDEAFLAGHFPGRPMVPGVLITEALAQLCGLVGQTGKSNDETPPQGMLVHADVRFKQPIVPPAEIELQASLTRTMGTLMQFQVNAQLNGKTAAKGMLTLSLT
jgi:3-hydroxyacyl-[acyl-carrier-protein] dehydratase